MGEHDQSNVNVPQWVLVQKTGKASFWLDEDIVTSIGSEGCNITVQSPTVGSQHAVLWFDPDSCYFYLKDLDTESGTFINGTKMNPAISTKLRNMDTIRFGFDSNLYQIRRESVPAQTQLKMEPEMPYPQSSMERSDSGICSSSPCSPTKGQFPSVSTCPASLDTMAERTISRQNSHPTQPASEELFSNKYSPMAFTVDFGPEETKNFDLSASISKFAPARHRRSASNAKARRAGSEGAESSNSKRNATPSTNSESDFGGIHNEKKKEKVLSSAIVSKNHKVVSSGCKPNFVEDDRKSETGTYTVDLEEATSENKKEGSLARDDVESPLDSSLEWVREWAEKASFEIEQNETPPPYKDCDRLFEPSSCDAEEVNFKRSRNPTQQQNKLNRSSWHECYANEQESRFHELTAPPPKLSPGLSRRLGREASAVSDYSAYGRSQPLQSHRPLSYTASYNVSRSNHQQTAGLSNEYYEKVSSPLGPRTPTSASGTTGTISPNSNISASSFSRQDGGRFSLRAPNRTKVGPPPSQLPQPAPKAWNPGPRMAQPRSIATIAPSSKPQLNTAPTIKKLPEKTVLSKKPLLSSGKRANSTLTAKEVELANWNRRKSYDPRKAAALAKNKEKRTTPEAADSDEPGQRNNPDGAASITKSPSFHNGAEYLGSSNEELGVGCDEDFEEPIRTGSLTRMRCRFDENQYHKQPPSPQRQKHKFEALDCLVISTIHSLSNKVRTASRQLLEKIQLQSVDDENGALVEEMISQLKELEVTASPQKGPSRELSGTLKNMKKIEQVILVLDRILCSEADEL